MLSIAGVANSAAMAAPSAGSTADGAVVACGPTEEASAVCLAVLKWTSNPVLAGLADTFVVRPAKIALIVLVAFVVQRLLRRAIKGFVGGMQGERAERGLGSIREHAPRLLVDTAVVPSLRRAQRAATIGALLRSISSLAVWSIAAVMAMSELGLNLGPLVAGAGIVGVALGFGAQHLVRDFVSGLFMLIEDQYGVGDIIDVGPATGKVESISLRTTRVRDVDGTVWHMPNGQIPQVGNKSQQWSRAVIDVAVAYETDIPHATGVIKATADAVWHDDEYAGLILEEPEVWGVENLGADGVVIRLVVKTAPESQFKVARELRARIKRAFDDAGIEIPFPQRTVWHRVDDESTLLVPAGVTGRDTEHPA